MQELKDRYMELYHKMAHSKEVERMRAFGSAEQWVFGMLAERHPELAKKWLEKLEATEWHNYLSEAEATEIVSNLKAQDGRTGAHWNLATFTNAVQSLNGDMERTPYYNNYALWATANMLYSDHAKSAAKYISEEQMTAYFYDLAVEKLTDVDRPHFIREYFHLG